MNKLFSKFLAEKIRIRNRLVAYKDYFFLFTDWYKVVFPINKLFSGRELLMHLRNGMKIFIRDSRSKDLSAIREVVGHNDYHLEDIRLPDNPIIFDVGANIGTFSMMAKKSYPTAAIYAFEPHPKNFVLLNKNAPFVVSQQVAITDSAGTVQFQEDGSPIGFKVIDDGSLTVPCLSLNDITTDLSRIDLLKIDVEGSEHVILQHASPDTFKKTMRILLEVHATKEYPLEQGRDFAENILRKESFEVTWVKQNVLFAEKLQKTQ